MDKSGAKWLLVVDNFRLHFLLFLWAFFVSVVISMLIGEYPHNMDAKGRIIVPSKLRESLGDKYVITIPFED